MTGLVLPPASGSTSEEVVAFAAGLAGRSGKAPVIEAALAHRTGRPRPLPARAVLTALLCLALDDRPLFLTDATRLLFCRISDASRALLGVTGTVAGRRGFLAAYRRVRYCFHAICSVMDPSPLPKNRRLTGEDLAKRTKPMAPAQAQAARGRLEAFPSSLLEASVSVLDQDERAAADGATGLDATPVPLFSRGPSRRTGLCASDPDGGWYVREGDHRDREDDKGKPLRKICWALEATIATTARLPGAVPGCPDLAIGLAITRPGEDPGGTGARVLASAAARGHKTGWPGYDRAYTQALPERFHLPARALGYKPVMDYRAGQPGIQANTGGAILAEGTWYCPALPEPLITATTSLRGHVITREPLGPADRRPLPLPAQAQRRPRRRRIPAAVLPRPRPPHRHHVPAARTITITARRTAQGTPAPARTPQALPPDRDHHRPRHRRPLPPGPALRQPSLAQVLRHLAQHHRRPQRLRQRPSTRSPRAASTAPCPRHHRPIDLHCTAADGRQHPQDPRLAGTGPRRKGQHHPPGPAAPGQPPRLPPRRLTARSTHSHHSPASPGQAATPRAVNSSATDPLAPRDQVSTATSTNVRPRHHTQRQVTARVLSV